MEDLDLSVMSDEFVAGYLRALRDMDETAEDCFGPLRSGRPIDGLRAAILMSISDAEAEDARR